MDRREAVKRFAFLLGGVTIGAELGISMVGCSNPDNKKTGTPFTEDEKATLAELADTFIPTTETPGAKAAGVGPFIPMMVVDCYPVEVSNVFSNGISTLDKVSRSQFDRPFRKLGQTEREQVLETIKEKMELEGPDDDLKDISQFLRLAGELTLLGYFTSEIGATQALDYVHIPGRYESCTDLGQEQKAWAT